MNAVQGIWQVPDQAQIAESENGIELIPLRNKGLGGCPEKSQARNSSRCVFFVGHGKSRVNDRRVLS